MREGIERSQAEADENPLHHLVCVRCQVVAKYCPCDMPEVGEDGERQVREWAARHGMPVVIVASPGTGTEAGE